MTWHPTSKGLTSFVFTAVVLGDSCKWMISSWIFEMFRCSSIIYWLTDRLLSGNILMLSSAVWVIHVVGRRIWFPNTVSNGVTLVVACIVPRRPISTRCNTSIHSRLKDFVVANSISFTVLNRRSTNPSDRGKYGAVLVLRIPQSWHSSWNRADSKQVPRSWALRQTNPLIKESPCDSLSLNVSQRDQHRKFRKVVNHAQNIPMATP